MSEAGHSPMRSTARVQLAAAYVLHAHDYRDTSRILELYTREHGRLSAFARGVRGPRSRLAPLLQPFTPLLVSWSGRGEAVHLSTAERRASPMAALTAAQLLPAWYLNELLMKLTTRHDPHPELFDDYESALVALAAGASAEAALRRFEKRLLDQLGYGIDFGVEATTGEPVSAERSYRYRLGSGLVAAGEGASGAGAASIEGALLQAIAAERFEEPGVAEAARRVMRPVLERLLEGRELATRKVARALAHRLAAADAAGAAAKREDAP